MLKQTDLTPIDITEGRIFFVRHFIVTGNKSEKLFKTFRYSVVCKDIKRAVELTEAAFPGCSVLSVADQGIIDKVD